VLASIAARFIFPAVSLEGRQMWLLRSSPLDLRALLWSKVLGRHHTAAGARDAADGVDQPAAQGVALHDDREP